MPLHDCTGENYGGVEVQCGQSELNSSLLCVSIQSEGCTAVQTRLVFRLSEAGGSSTLVGETSSAPPWPPRCRAVPDSQPLRPERHRGRR